MLFPVTNFTEKKAGPREGRFLCCDVPQQQVSRGQEPPDHRCLGCPPTSLTQVWELSLGSTPPAAILGCRPPGPEVPLKLALEI